MGKDSEALEAMIIDVGGASPTGVKYEEEVVLVAESRVPSRSYHTDDEEVDWKGVPASLLRLEASAGESLE